MPDQSLYDIARVALICLNARLHLLAQVILSDQRKSRILAHANLIWLDAGSVQKGDEHLVRAIEHALAVQAVLEDEQVRGTPDELYVVRGSAVGALDALHRLVAVMQEEVEMRRAGAEFVLVTGYGPLPDPVELATVACGDDLLDPARSLWIADRAAEIRADRARIVDRLEATMASRTPISAIRELVVELRKEPAAQATEGAPR